MSTKPNIYLDNAATTRVDKEVGKEILRGTRFFANPSSFNDLGRIAKKELEKARFKIARFLGAHSDEVIFTSSGSEANNLAIKGITEIPSLKNSTSKYAKYEVITTPIEHPSVLEPVKELEKRGFAVKRVKVNDIGLVNLDDLKNQLSLKTKLVSIMYANNEIGTIESIYKIAKIIKDFNQKLEIGNWKLKINGTNRVLFHTDACQATGYLDMNVNHLGVDLLTFNGTKIYGPRGIGTLYVRRGVKLNSQISGGDQEFGLRAGTENLPAILGLAKAIELIKKDEAKKTSVLRDYFFSQIKSKLSEARINGPAFIKDSAGKIDLRLPNNISISVPNFSSEVILLELDKYGIYAGSGSACAARSVEPSHVLKAVGVDSKYINGTIRFSLGRQTTRRGIDYTIRTFIKIISDLKKRYKY